MRPLKAHVRNGRLVLDEPTDLPGGELVCRQMVHRLTPEDDDAEVDDAKRAELHRELEDAIADADHGETEDFAAVIAELRSR